MPKDKKQRQHNLIVTSSPTSIFTYEYDPWFWSLHCILYFFSHLCACGCFHLSPYAKLFHSERERHTHTQKLLLLFYLDIKYQFLSPMNVTLTMLFMLHTYAYGHGRCESCDHKVANKLFATIVMLVSYLRTLAYRYTGR